MFIQMLTCKAIFHQTYGHFLGVIGGLVLLECVVELGVATEVGAVAVTTAKIGITNVDTTNNQFNSESLFIHRFC